MIKLSNGVEISEDTVVSALKKSGISVEPKHIFRAGDVAKNYNVTRQWRLIISKGGTLYAVDELGVICGSGQRYFEDFNYKFVGRQKDLLKSN